MPEFRMKSNARWATRVDKPTRACSSSTRCCHVALSQTLHAHHVECCVASCTTPVHISPHCDCSSQVVSFAIPRAVGSLAMQCFTLELALLFLVCHRVGVIAAHTSKQVAGWPNLSWETRVHAAINRTQRGGVTESS